MEQGPATQDSKHSGERLERSGWEQFGRGWSAVLVAESWVLLEPTDGTGGTRPAELPGGLLCIVTSDNPHGETISDDANRCRRQQLYAWVTEHYRSEWFVSGGGEGSLLLPETWPGFEEGVVVPVRNYGEAAAICRQFDQAAVYVLDGGAGVEERVLLNADCEVFRRQRYRTHRLSQETATKTGRTT